MHHDQSATPSCPRCGEAMSATERLATVRQMPAPWLARAQGEDGPQRSIPVWQCEICDIARPRYL